MGSGGVLDWHRIHDHPANPCQRLLYLLPSFVRVTGIEPARSSERENLNLVRLPSSATPACAVFPAVRLLSIRPPRTGESISLVQELL